MSQQQAQGYRFGQHAGTARAFRDPSKLLKQGANAEVVKASWKHTNTIFRPYPVVVNGVPQPYRFDEEESNFTDWIRSYRAVMGVGNPGIDFILCDPSDPTVDRSQNPYEMIYGYVQMLKKSNSLPNHIFALTQGGNNRGAALPNTSAVTLVQGALMVHNNEPKMPARGSADNDPTCILALKSQAGDDLIALLNEKRQANAPQIDPNRAAADPFAATFTYGDVTHPRFGAFFHFIQKGAPQQGGQGAFGGQRGGQRQQIEIGYNVAIIDRLNNGVSSDMSSIVNTIINKWTPWDEILHIPTIQEQINYLCAVLPPDLIVAALADRYRDLIPQNVMQAGGRGVPAGAAYGGPGGAPPAAGGYGGQGGYGGGYERPVDPGPAPAGGGYGAPAAGGYGAPAAGGYGQPAAGGYGQPAAGGYGQPNVDPNQNGYAPPNQGGGDYGWQGGNAGAGAGGYGQPAAGAGGYGAPAAGVGGYGAPAAGGGFAGAAPAGGGGAAGYGGPPPQTGYGGGGTGMMTPGAGNVGPAAAGPAGTVDAQSAIEQARRSAAAGAQPPVMQNQPPVHHG